MKKSITILSATLALVLVFSACSTNKTMQEGGKVMDGKTEVMDGKTEVMDGKTGATSKGSMTDANGEMVKTPAPDFMFTDLEGNTVALADFEDKKVYVKFWASWCSICVKSLPETDELAAMDKDFEVLAVVAPGFSGEKSAEDFKDWYKKLGYKNITVVLDDNGKYMKEFGVRAYPSSAHIDADGTLLDFTVGHSSNDKVKKIFEEKAAK